MKRTDNWPQKLRCFTEEMRGAAFAWGTADCCTNACRWIRLAWAGDVDVFAEFRGYTTEAEAMAKIESVCGGSKVEDAAVYVATKFEMAEIAPLMAQRGDVVLFEGTEGQMLGVVSLHGAWALFLTQKGFLRLPVKECKRAWRV